MATVQHACCNLNCNRPSQGTAKHCHPEYCCYRCEVAIEDGGYNKWSSYGWVTHHGSYCTLRHIKTGPQPEALLSSVATNEEAHSSERALLAAARKYADRMARSCPGTYTDDMRQLGSGFAFVSFDTQLVISVGLRNDIRNAIVSSGGDREANACMSESSDV